MEGVRQHHPQDIHTMTYKFYDVSGKNSFEVYPSTTGETVLICADEGEMSIGVEFSLEDIKRLVNILEAEVRDCDNG